jgi:hypothetical protein
MTEKRETIKAERQQSRLLGNRQPNKIDDRELALRSRASTATRGSIWKPERRRLTGLAGGAA